MFKGLSGLGSLMKQAQEIGGRMQGINEELKGCRMTGAAGGGMVEIEVNGLMEILGCQIEEQLLAQNDRELLEDLIVTAMNQAVAKAKQQHAEKLKSLTGGIELPGLDAAMNNFLGTNSTPSES